MNNLPLPFSTRSAPSLTSAAAWRAGTPRSAAGRAPAPAPALRPARPPRGSPPPASAPPRPRARPATWRPRRGAEAGRAGLRGGQGAMGSGRRSVPLLSGLSPRPAGGVCRRGGAGSRRGVPGALHHRRQGFQRPAERRLPPLPSRLLWFPAQVRRRSSPAAREVGFRKDKVMISSAFIFN